MTSETEYLLQWLTVSVSWIVVIVQLMLTFFPHVDDMYNIPKGVDCMHDLDEWVYSGDDHKRLLNTPPWNLPEYVRRFTQDLCMCVYLNHDVLMYA